jgi:large subunit ribosomal protein L1
VESVSKAKPSTSKGKYLKGLHISSTMGPSIRVDINSVTAK